MRALVLLMVFLVFTFPFKAQAAEFSGSYLVQMCASDKEGKEIIPGGHIACQAYISGVVDYHILIRSLGTAPSVDFCIPENTSLYDLQKKVFVYLLRHKEEHGGFVAAPAVSLALFESYPCKKK